MLRALCLAACFVVVAGCSSRAPDPPVTPTPTFTATAQPAPSSGVALTDTMHLLDRTHVAGMAPTGSEVIRVPVYASGMPVMTTPATEDARWSMPRSAGLSHLAGTATLWVEVQGTVTNSDPADPCFWRAQLYAVRANGGGGGGPGFVVSTDRPVCVSESAVVPPGVHALHFDFPGYDLTDATADTLVLHIEADDGIEAPGATLTVLTGTPEYDSQVTVYGLQLPLTTQTFLT